MKRDFKSIIKFTILIFSALALIILTRTGKAYADETLFFEDWQTSPAISKWIDKYEYYNLLPAPFSGDMGTWSATVSFGPSFPRIPAIASYDITSGSISAFVSAETKAIPSGGGYIYDPAQSWLHFSHTRTFIPFNYPIKVSKGDPIFLVVNFGSVETTVEYSFSPFSYHYYDYAHAQGWVFISLGGFRLNLAPRRTYFHSHWGGVDESFTLEEPSDIISGQELNLGNYVPEGQAWIINGMSLIMLATANVNPGSYYDGSWQAKATARLSNLDSIRIFKKDSKLVISNPMTDKEKYRPKEQVKVNCDVLDEKGSKVSSAYVTAEIMMPDETTETIPLWETQTGKYEGAFTNASLSGDYNVTIKAQKEGYAPAAAQLSFIVPVEIILTFDDGPVGDEDNPLGSGKNYTENILNDLYINDVHNDIKAAFFIQTHAAKGGGSSIGGTLIKKEDKDGHIVGVHTGGNAKHRYWPYVGEDRHPNRAQKPAYDVGIFCDYNGDGKNDPDGIPDGENALESDLIAAKWRIGNLTGAISEFVRPPYYDYGKTKEEKELVLSTYTRQGLKMIITDAEGKEGGDARLSWKDWIRFWLQWTVKNAIKEHEIYQIVVTLHDTNNDVAEYLDCPEDSLLDAIIDGVKDGMELETTEEALLYTQFITSKEDIKQILRSKTEWGYEKR